ncbi:MAG: hypothetical protein OXC95_11205, partial [Dehalococcoidia bacterium]|nr:hypothetical protein [Dehalococcoidia bacterium]
MRRRLIASAASTISIVVALLLLVIAAAPPEEEPLRRETARVFPPKTGHHIETMPSENGMHCERIIALYHTLNMTRAVRTRHLYDHRGRVRAEVRKACFAFNGV